MATLTGNWQYGYKDGVINMDPVAFQTEVILNRVAIVQAQQRAQHSRQLQYVAESADSNQRIERETVTARASVNDQWASIMVTPVPPDVTERSRNPTEVS